MSEFETIALDRIFIDVTPVLQNNLRIYYYTLKNISTNNLNNFKIILQRSTVKQLSIVTAKFYR